MKHFLTLFFIGSILFAQDRPKPEETEVWEPEPRVVAPGIYNGPPSDAVVLFDGTDLSKWRNAANHEAAEWTINKDGSMTVKPRSGSIETTEDHGSMQLHVEWKSPTVIKGEGQGRGNSGIIFQRRYEVQVLDSYNNRTYSNGQATSIYKQHIPLVNAMRPTGEWQTYDIVFTEPKFDADGNKITSGRFTVFHNGIIVQNSVEILGTTEHIGAPKNKRDDMAGYEDQKHNHRTLMLQDHGDLVSYRNIWMRKL